MENPTSKSIEFRCGLNGLVSKQSPDLLTSGQYRSLLNVFSMQEGSISSRLGIKKIGQIPSGQNTCYFIRKLVVANTEDPLVPSTNPRYLGVLTTAPARNIYRTTDYISTTLVVSGADSNAARHWEMADYSAGETGAPWAYLACPNGMFKDSGIAPASTLPKWGIQPACGAALAVSVLAGAGGASAISVIDAYQDRGATGPVAVFITTNAGGVASGVADGDVVTLSGIGIVPNTCATGNGLYYAKVIGYSNSVSDPYYSSYGQGSAFGLYDSNGQGVLPSGAFTTGGTVSGIAVGGNLNGGASSSPNSTQPYDWIFTYQEVGTNAGVTINSGDEGNPSQAMLTASAATDTIGGIVYSGFPLAINGGQVKVAVWGTGVAGIGSIRVYRRGGALTDGIYRLVATVANPGSETAATITDNTADADLVYASQGPGVYNAPPVTSTLQTPIKTTSTGSISTGWQTVTVAASVLSPVLPGTTIHILDPAGSEDVIVESSTGTTFRAYFQLAHGSAVPIEIDAITGAYCNLVVSMQDALLVAGDPNNPHVLYKSATGTPQYFPVGLDAAGAVTSIGVGTPSNGIVNMCEFRGQVLTLNVSNLFEVPVINGSLILPAKVADKGLAAQSAWCKTDTEVWFLSDDGVYSWDGGSLRKRSPQIDGVFKGLQVNNIPPLIYEPNYLQMVRLEYRQGYVHVAYTAQTAGLTELVCEPEFGDRWTLVSDSGVITNPNKGTSMLYREPDTKSLVVAGYNSGGAVFGLVDISDVAVGGPQANITSDWWSSAPNSDGNAIPWSITLPWFDMGKPNWKKVVEEVWLDVDPELYSGTYSSNSTLSVDLLLDFSDSVVETTTITVAMGSPLLGRQLLAILPLLASESGTYESFGREARAISFVIRGAAYPFPQTLYGVVIQYQETGLLTAGGATDWDNLGSEYDKRLYQMKVEFDVEGTNQTIVLDTVNGINGNTYNQAVQSFVLSNPILTGAGPGRALKVFPVADQTIAKLVRVRPVASVQAAGTFATVFFKVHSATFDKEIYPADIVTQTSWTNGGYEYLKYANQIDLQVNTNNQLVTVQLQADNETVFTFQVNGIITDRQRNITIPAGISGFLWRLYVDPNQTAIATNGGQFQLWAHSIKFQPADKGEVQHTGDWDDLGHPWDKYLRTVTVEWDGTLDSNVNVTLQMDTLTGIGGQTVNTAVATFVLTGGRSKCTFPIVEDTIAKMIRLYPEGGTIPAGFKQWRYFFDFEKYPADTILSAPWKDASTPNDKNPSWLWIDADTQGVPASVILQDENGTVLTVQHTGSVDNRKKNYPIQADVFAKMWRLLITPGTGGKFQMWLYGFDRWQPTPEASGSDPCEVLLWTPWNDFGYPYPKLARNLILTINTGGVTCSVALQTQEAGTVETFSITTTYTTRRVIMPCTANLSGTQWRLLLTPGAGGLSKLWDWSLEIIKEPAAVTYWDSYEQTFGYKFFKFVKQGWWQYTCSTPVTLTILSDTGTFSVTLPAHPVARSIERFLLPTVWGAGLNKSKTYRVQLSASTPFQFYAEGSGLEWLGLGEDRHSAYRQMNFNEIMTLGEGGG